MEACYGVNRLGQWKQCLVGYGQGLGYLRDLGADWRKISECSTNGMRVSFEAKIL